jgi:hypothetical protein
VSSPPERDVDNLAGFLYGIKGLEGLCEDCPLLDTIERLSKGMAEWPAQENGPRRLHLHSIFPHNRDPYGRNADPFDLPLYQSQGLIAYASTGCEQHGINPCCLQPPGHLGRGLPREGLDMGSPDVTHEAVMDISELT